MRTTIHNLIEAKKAEREENGEAGFSLIELIIVVVILGILVAIAVPIFNGIQEQARTNSLHSIAADAASAVAAGLALQPPTVTATGDVPDTVYKTNDATVTVAIAAGGGATLTVGNFCVTAAAVTTGPLNGAANQTSGPGC